MGADKRYQTNVDSLGRIPTENQAGLGIEPSYVTVGNFPVTLRESMLGVTEGTIEALSAASQTRDHTRVRGQIGSSVRYDLGIDNFLSGTYTGADALLGRIVSAGFRHVLIIVNHWNGGTWPSSVPGSKASRSATA